MKDYIFSSKRLGFREWRDKDLSPLSAINSSTEVMRYFPRTLSQDETLSFIGRMQKHYDLHGYTYYAVDHLESGDMIGFIGMRLQEYESPYTPAKDIGWRLAPQYWHRGLATEGAIACLDHAKQVLNLKHIISVCTHNNTPSENVMQKIGMEYKGEFDHPALSDSPDIQRCKVYDIHL